MIHVLPKSLIFITKYYANARTFQLTRVRFHLKIVGSFLPEVYGCKQRGVPIKRISTRKPIEIVTEYDGKEGLVIAYFGRYTEKQLMNSYLI